MKRKNFLEFVISIILLLFCVILHKYPVFSIIAASLWIGHIFALLKNNKTFALRYIYYIYSTCAVVFSVLLCEFINGYYLTEINSHSHYVGSLPLLVLGLYVFLICLENIKVEKTKIVPIISYKNYNRTNGKNERQLKAIRLLHKLNIIVLVLLLYLFLSIISKPAFLYNTDRTFYFIYYAPRNKLFTFLNGQTSVMVAIPLLLLILDRSKRFLPTASIIVYSLFQLWVGNKFTPFISVASIFFMLYTSDVTGVNEKKIKKILKIGVLFMATAVVLAVIIQSQLSGLNRQNYAVTRTMQQGQLWWKTYDITKEIHPEEFINEIENIFSGRVSISDYVDSNVGIYKIMYLCGPKSLIDHRLSTGSRYTEGGYACAYVYFGTVGVILFAIFNAFIVAHIVKGIFKSVENYDYIRFIILVRILLRFNAFMSMFTLAEMLDLECIISYIYLILLYNKKISIGKKGLFLQNYRSVSENYINKQMIEA